MKIANVGKAIGLAVGTLTFTACGGGGGANVASIPPPPVIPPPSVTTTPTTAANYIVAATGPDQGFASKGGYVSFNPITGQSLAPTTTEGDQLQVRYDSGSNQYQIQLPASTFWEGLYLNPSHVPNTRDFRTSGVTSGNSPTHFQLHEYAATGYSHSALALWSISSAQAGIVGAVAFGIPTPSGAVPSVGNATFNGSIIGRSTETSFDVLAGGYWPAIVEGGIGLSFNFGAGTLSGSISPTIYNLDRRALAPMSFVNTVYSVGATSFSGAFNTTVPGISSFSGQFTGPGARELLGSFAFPYTSPDDGRVYQANGAFVAKN